MKREWWLRVSWVAGLLASVVGLLACLILFIWDIAGRDIFGLRAIDYWDALGLALLLGLIFGFIYLLKEDVR